MSFCGKIIKNLSGKRDSDPRPQPWQGCALPTELFPQKSDSYRIQTYNLLIRSQMLYSVELRSQLAVRTGLEPVTPCVTGMYSNLLN